MELQMNHDDIKCLARAVVENNTDLILKYITMFPFSEWSKSIFTIPLPPQSVDDASRKTSTLQIPSTSLSLLHIAAFEDSLEAFVLLNKIPLNIQSADSYLPIHYACYGGSKEVLTYILTKDPKQATTNFCTEYNCLQLATLSNSPVMLNILFSYGTVMPVFSAKDPISSAIRQRNVEMLNILLKHTRSSIRNEGKNTPIMLAIMNNKPDAVPMLIDANVDLSVINNDYQTALSLACFQGQTDVVRLICEKLDDIDLPANIKQQAAVHWLCQSKDPEIARIMLEKNIDVNRVDKDGFIGPHYLIDIVEPSVHIKILELLLQHGLKIDFVSNPNGNTILGEYVTGIKKQYEVIDWLLSHGANIDAPLNNGNMKGQTIADFILNCFAPGHHEPNATPILKKIALKWIPERIPFLEEEEEENE